MPCLPTLVTRVLAGSFKRYKTCLALLFPALVALVFPIQLAMATLNRGIPSQADRLPASIFALQLTILSILTSYAFLPRVIAALRARPTLPKIYALKPQRRMLIAAATLLAGLSLTLGPGRYALPALAFVALFWAAWPWVCSHAEVGYRLIKRGLRLWKRRRFSEKLTVALAFVLAQAAPLVLGRAAAEIVGAVGGPQVAWTTQVLLAAVLLPAHLLIFVNLGTKLRLAHGVQVPVSLSASM